LKLNVAEARLSRGLTTDEGGDMPTIVKWTPFRDLDTVERRMRRMLEDVGFAPALPPAADVYETDDEVVVELEVPGYEETDLDIEVADHTITVKGERTEVKDEKQKSFRVRERLEHEFERRFDLPPVADVERVAAVFEKGVLELRAPTVQTVTPHKVEIAKT
jgi:HSP20 family protein